MKTAALLAAALLSLTAATGARADTLEAGAAPQVNVSYRGQVFAADGIAILAMASGVAAKSDLGTVGVAIGLAGGPAVHLAHGNPGRAAASLGLRVALPWAGAWLAASQCQQDNEENDSFDCIGSLLVGATAGYGVAALVDAGLLAHQTRAVKEPSWAPQVAVAPGAVHLGISGHF